MLDVRTDSALRLRAALPEKYKTEMKNSCRSILFFLLLSSFFSFDTKAQVSKKAIDDFLNDSAISTGHAGISIYDPASGKYLFNYNAKKNFTPSSNTKLFTLYAGMKYLGDSLPGLRYIANNSSIELFPTGDPTFLHPDFKSQRVYDFLKSNNRVIEIISGGLTSTSYGKGWAWDDYEEDFMPERSAFPIYGNLITFYENGAVIPNADQVKPFTKFDNFPEHSIRSNNNFPQRDFLQNNFNPLFKKKNEIVRIPFLTSDNIFKQLLKDTIHKIFNYGDSSMMLNNIAVQIIHSRPVDSLFRPMMFNSDNFFAEQTLLMVSNEKLGYMSDEDIIDSLLKNDLRDIPTKPRWVDGSGLSRYNLFSPKALIYILVKLKNEFGLARMERILPTGGQGTLANYYENAAGFIYAKTGSMSNNVSLSGYLVTKKNKLLIFSVIINNFNGTGRAGRQAIEKLIESIRLTN